MKKWLLTSVALLVVGLISNQSIAQSYKLVPDEGTMSTSETHIPAGDARIFSLVSDESTMSISGTSNVHDWHSNVETININAVIEVPDSSKIAVKNLELTIPVESIKSGKGGMDKKTYGALKEKEYPDITFQLLAVKEVSDDSLTASADLTIAGKTSTILLTVGYQLFDDGSVQFFGSYPIKMSDYDINPPKAALGSIKAGDDVEVHFDIKLNHL